MIMLGIILVLLAVLIGLGGLWATSGDHALLQLNGPLGLNLELSPMALIVFGMISMGLLWAGWWMMKYGTKRGLSRRRERKDLEREKREHERALAATNAKLGRERETTAEAERRREEDARRLAAERQATERDTGAYRPGTGDGRDPLPPRP